MNDSSDSDKDYHPEAVGALPGILLIMGFAFGAVWLCVQVVKMVLGP